MAGCAHVVRMAKRRIAEALRRAIRLRCPRCGRGALFRGWFSMHERCPVCDMLLEREQGYFVGAIYVNYAATVGITIAGFLLLDAYTDLSITTEILLWSAFGVIFP